VSITSVQGLEERRGDSYILRPPFEGRRH